MTVKTKLLILSLELIGIFMVWYYLTYQHQERDIAHLLAGQAEQSARALDRMLDLENRPLQLLTMEYSQRQEAIAFLISEHTSDLEKTFANALSANAYDGVWVYSSAGKRLYFAGTPGESELPADLLAPEAIRVVFQDNAVAHFFSVNTAGEVFEVTGRVFPPSQSASASQGQGYLFLARRWNAAFLGALSAQSESQMLLLPLKDLPVGQAAFTSQVIVRRTLPGWDQEPITMILEVRYPNAVILTFLNMRDRITIFYTFAVVFSLLVLLTALYTWAALPLKKVSRGLGEGNIAPVRKLLKSPDEFGHIARLMQRSFQQQQDLDTEILQRKEMETALRASEEAYRGLVDHSIQGLAVIQNGRIVFANATLAASLGYPVSELLALEPEQVFQLVDRQDRTVMIERLQQCVQEDIGQYFEARFCRQDDSSCWMEIFVNRVKYQAEPAVQIACVDISYHKEAQQALQLEQDFARAVLSAVNSIILVLDARGHVARCNPACERIAGYSLAEMQKMTFWDLFGRTEDKKRLQRRFRELVASREVLQQENLFHVAGGQDTWFSWSNSFMFGPDGEVQYVVISGIDVTERRHKERQQEAIALLASDLRGFLPREQMLRIILTRVMQFLRADQALIAIQDLRSGYLVVEQALGEGTEGFPGRPLLEGQEVFTQSVKSRQPYLSTGGLEHHLNGMTPDSEENQMITAWVPLVMEGEVTGMLAASCPAPVQQSDLQALTAVTDIAASAVHRSFLADETQRRLQRLSALYTINIAVSASLDINVTINVLVNQVTTQLGAGAADIFLVDPLSRDLNFVAGHGFRDPCAPKASLWLGQGIVGQAALVRKSMQIFDPNGIAEHFLPIRRLAGEEFVAYYAVPLIHQGEVKGVLETFHRAPYEPDPEWLSFLEALANETTIALNNAEMLDKLQRTNQNLALAYDATLEGWALALDMRDHVTEDHTRRVTDLTIRLAQSLGISGDELKHIRYGALLHDIGKIAIPDSILNKPGPLTDEEWVIMRKHPEYSLQMLSSIPFLNPALAIPYSHHERWDGSGYPQKLSGKQIPLAARIFAVVDVWDALSYNRVYRDPLPEDEVLAYLQQEAGHLFDPEIVKAFVEIRSLLRS